MVFVLVESDLGHESGEARVGAQGVGNGVNVQVNQPVDPLLILLRLQSLRIRRRRILRSNVLTVGTPADRLPDETLLAGLGAGDAELSVAFVRRFQSHVYGVALAIVGEATLAEDIAQQAFERAWRSAGRYDTDKAGVTSTSP